MAPALPLYVGVVPPVVRRRPLAAGALALALALAKVGVCMSVCLHRYAAHRAFDWPARPPWPRCTRHARDAGRPDLVREHAVATTGTVTARATRTRQCRPRRLCLLLSARTPRRRRDLCAGALQLGGDACARPLVLRAGGPRWSLAYALVAARWASGSRACRRRTASRLTLGFNVNNHPKTATADGAGCRAIDSAGDDDAAKGASAMHTLQSWNLLCAQGRKDLRRARRIISPCTTGRRRSGP